MIVDKNSAQDFICPIMSPRLGGTPARLAEEIGNCQGSNCMAWIWVRGQFASDEKRRGYCGLTSEKPE